MLQLHPDKLSPTLSEADIADISDKFHNVKDAYEFLTSPLHLASRRLYMTKMASRRAEYERREAYMRRNGGADSRSSSAGVGGVPSGYSTGGGGAAGMAGTGMPTYTTQQHPPQQQRYQQQHASTANSYAMPKSKHTRHRAKSEPEMEGGEETGGSSNERRRGSATNHFQPRYYKNMGGQRDTRGRSGHSHHNPTTTTTTKHRDASSRGRGVRGGEQNGYKSDSHTMKTKSQNRDRRRSSNNIHSKDDRERQQHPRERGKSEEPRYHNNEKNYGTRGDDGGGGGEGRRRTREKSTHTRDHSRDNREREREREFSNKRRGRATSAPARYSSKSDKYKDDVRGSYDKSSNSNSLPKEFFCPLTKRLMKDPVKDTEGNTYEREAIERWLRVQSSSPITNRYLSLGMIRPDKELKRAIYKVTGESVLWLVFEYSREKR